MCNANALTVFGLAFRLGDKTLLQSLAFYVVGTLCFWVVATRGLVGKKLAAQAAVLGKLSAATSLSA